MKLKVLVPTEVLVDEEAAKIHAEATNGHFCLLPRHIDIVAALVPGILSFVNREGGEAFVALDEGILVKCGSEVLVSTTRGIRGDDLEGLQTVVETQFQKLNEQERTAHLAMARLEASFIRGTLEQQRGRT
ncbi:MAG: F0F1 ATP synthase subunit epsilon [Chloroflexaceae bacterium]|nr:F0F1 ATP synthase subunit epsilon [Chloroflexaceae bacterium]